MQSPAKPPLVVSGMWGVGDCIFQRAPVRELMSIYEVTLETYYPPLYHDLVERGLKLRIIDRLKPRMRFRTPVAAEPPYPRNPRRMRMTYNKQAIHSAGSILGAMYQSCGLTMPQRPDFSLPVLPAWRDWFRDEFLSRWDTRGKPIMVYRPIVLNNVWNCPARSPDPIAYSALFRLIRDRFFVVSIANLKGDEAGKDKEWIVGPEEDADVRLHADELDFETMAELFSESALIFCNAGFSPVLAQAVGAPVICVYGGKESSKTTQAVSRHLSPNLFVEPVNPCDCHDCGHACDKRIDLDHWIPKVEMFSRLAPGEFSAPAATVRDFMKCAS